MENVLETVCREQGPLTVHHKAPSHHRSAFGGGYGADIPCTMPPTGTEKEALGDVKMGLPPLRGTTSPSALEETVAHRALLLSPASMYVLQKHQSPAPCQPRCGFCCPEHRASSLTWWSGHRPRFLAPCSPLAKVSRAQRAMMEILGPQAPEYAH